MMKSYYSSIKCFVSSSSATEPLYTSDTSPTVSAEWSSNQTQGNMALDLSNKLVF